MAQWQEVQNLANTYLEQIHQLYASAALPVEVRQCLAAWIEEQNWRQAAEPLSSHAWMLFHSLLALLGDCLGSPGVGDEDFMLKHNLRKACRDLQAKFGERPENFANLVANLLQEERRILRLGQERGQQGATPAPSTPPESDREQQIQQRLAEFHTALQEAERTFQHLEDVQDTFDFCYKVHYLPGEDRTRDPQYAQQVQALQAKLQALDRQRREVLAQMQQLLGRSETLRDFLQQELGAWQERQRRACLGAPADTNLRPLETWFTELVQGLFQLLKLLRVLEDLQQKLTYERDPLKAEIPLLERRLRELLTYLLQRAFVVEQQPSMPNTFKRPLVLRTASKFSARARLLVRLHDRNHRMEAKIHIDREPPKIKGFRKFNILTSSSKTLLAGDNPQDGLVCDFQYLTLKEQKESRSGKGNKGTGEGPLVVTEELHLITFTLAYAYCGLELELETSTLPFVIISNNNQLSSAWASILWINMLSSNPKQEQQFFSAPPPAPWPQLAEVLSWQFKSVAERGLGQDHLLMLAEKLFGSKPSPESALAWSKFSKDGASGFSFWAWLDEILGLLHKHLKQLWKDGLILGFVSRKQEKKLLKGKRTGTFLIRFSESVLGGVTCTWVEHPSNGPPAFRAVVPYTTVELASLALPDIIRDYQLLMEENIPENPLQFLYPDTARDEAFGPYYSQRQEENLMEQKKYLNRRLIRVSSRQANESWQTEEELVVATENLETLQLQPSGLGTQWPGGLAPLQPVNSGALQVTSGNLGTLQPSSPGTLQVTSGNLGTLQPSSPGTVQMMAMSPGTLQVTSGNLGTLQPSSPGTLQVTSGNLGTLQPLSPGTVQVMALSPGTLQVTSGNLGTLQPSSPGTVQVMAVSPGTLQVTSGNLGTLQPSSPGTVQVMAVSPGMLQVTSGNLGTLQVLATSLGKLQPGPQGLEPPRPLPGGSGVTEMPQPGTGNLEPQLVQLVPEGQGVLQVGPGGVGTLQMLPTGLGMLQHEGPKDQGTQQVGPRAVEPQLMMQLVPEGQGTLQVGPEGLGTLQPATGDTRKLQQVGAGDTGMLQQVPGAVEPLLVPEEQGTLPPELRDLEPLSGSPDMQELLESLAEGVEPGSGTLEALEVVELMPSMLEAVDGDLAGLNPRLAGRAVLLDPHDPFLPQAEDVPGPPVNSLFATDFPPLHIDANDFQ